LGDSPTLGDGRITVRLGELKPRWEAHCAALDLPAAAVVRDAIVAALAQESPPTAKCDVPHTRERHRLSIRLSVSEYAALKSYAERDGISVNRWVVSLLRARITRRPQLVTAELEAFSRSTAALGGIGRNLNQIAKVLNSHPEGVPTYRFNVLKALEVEIAETRTVIRALLATDHERWNG
jgi:hypothetical protein